MYYTRHDLIKPWKQLTKIIERQVSMYRSPKDVYFNLNRLSFCSSINLVIIYNSYVVLDSSDIYLSVINKQVCIYWFQIKD